MNEATMQWLVYAGAMGLGQNCQMGLKQITKNQLKSLPAIKYPSKGVWLQQHQEQD